MIHKPKNSSTPDNSSIWKSDVCDVHFKTQLLTLHIELDNESFGLIKLLLILLPTCFTKGYISKLSDPSLGTTI